MYSISRLVNVIHYRYQLAFNRCILYDLKSAPNDFGFFFFRGIFHFFRALYLKDETLSTFDTQFISIRQV